MQDLILNPPIFPLLLKQAIQIAGDLIDSSVDLNKMPNSLRRDLSALVRIVLAQSFWGGAFIDTDGKSAAYMDCLETVHDENLEAYWEHHRSAKAPVIARPLNNELCKKVAYYNNNLDNDISTFRDLVKDYLKPNSSLENLMKNMKALCEILILDGHLITKDFCSSDSADKIMLTNKDTLKSEDDAQKFVPKTTMISEKTYYFLTGVLILGSIGIYAWSRQKTKNI